MLYSYLPIANTAFGSAPISLREWVMTAVLAVVIILLTEAAKAVTRARARPKTALRQPS